MIKTMKRVALISFIATILFWISEAVSSNSIFTSLAITSGTFFYHFSVRLLIGYAVDGIFKNRMDYNNPWFRQRDFEEKLYNLLKVKNRKGKMPTAVPGTFDIRKNNPYDVAMAMCQAEIVHELIVLVSFLPIIASIWFGAFWVFFVTSLLAACYDMVFVIIQRYNRPRILMLAEKQEAKNRSASA